MGVVRGIALRGVAVVRTRFSSPAGTSHPVEIIPNRRASDSPVGSRHQRGAVVVVSDVIAGTVDVVLEHLRDVGTDRVPALTFLLVLERRIRFGTMDEVESRTIASGTITVEVEVANVERAKFSHSTAGVPEQLHDYVPTIRIFVAVEIIDDFDCAVRFEGTVAHVVRPADLRERYLVVEVFPDAINFPTESEECAERSEVAAERDVLEFRTGVAAFASPDTIGVEVPTGQVVEIRKPLFVAPCDEGLQSVVMTFQCVLSGVVAGLDVEVEGFRRLKEF
jgi:hypothetical protein